MFCSCAHTLRTFCFCCQQYFLQNSYKTKDQATATPPPSCSWRSNNTLQPLTFLVQHISSFPQFNSFYPIHPTPSIHMWDSGSSTRFAFQGVTVIQEPVLLGYRDQARKIALYRQTERPLSPKPSLFARVWVKEANDLMASDGNRNIAGGCP